MESACIGVYSGGQQFDYARPEAFEYSLRDIAHSLSQLCRYVGQGRWWSVGQHSILLSELVEPRDRLRALLHDASEAYMADVPGPLKQMEFMRGYRELEGRVMRAIHRQFGLPEDAVADARVKWFDVAVRPAEAELIGLDWPRGEHVWIPTNIREIPLSRVEQVFYERGVEYMSW